MPKVMGAPRSFPQFSLTIVKTWMRFYPEILHSDAFQCPWDENFFQPWWSVTGDFTQDTSFWCIWHLLSSKFSSTMVKNRTRFYQKSFILVCFSAPKFKIFFNHGEKLNEILPRNPSFIFKHGEVLMEILLKILHSGLVEISWVENFPQPWWKIECGFTNRSFIVVVRFSAPKFRIFFNHVGNKLHDILPINLSFSCVSVLLDWKFPSTMVKKLNEILPKILYSGVFQCS